MATGMRADLEIELSLALQDCDKRVYGNGVRETLEVNRPKRVIPEYPLVPSHHHPDPFGIESYRKDRVHKKSHKTLVKKGR